MFTLTPPQKYIDYIGETYTKKYGTKKIFTQVMTVIGVSVIDLILDPANPSNDHQWCLIVETTTPDFDLPVSGRNLKQVPATTIQKWIIENNRELPTR